MSYILEALADSEQARLQVAGAPKYSLLPAVGEEVSHHRRWPYVLAAALLVNAVVLQVWLRPALPGGVVSTKMPTVLQVAEPPAAEPRMASLARNDMPAADVAAIALSEVRPPESQPERVYDRRVARPPAPADVVASTAPANPANDSAPVHIPKLAPSVMAKRSAEAAVASEAKSTPTTSKASRYTEAAVATAAKPTPAPSAAKRGVEVAVVPEVTPTLLQTSPTRPSPTPAGGTAEMPTALQQEMPTLAVAGFIRDEGSGSMVIVNDRLVREGDEVAPGVKLEKILNDSLVFEYRGYRFKR
jgi:general secretion pathway protein B